jgi:hypothetical protein
MKTLKTLKFLVFTSVLFTFISSCKKNDTGGTATIHALVFHHDTPILGSTAYVKFNADKEPSNPTTNYDLKIEGEEDENHVHIADLRPGKYYVYAGGYDSTSKKNNGFKN